MSKKEKNKHVPPTVTDDKKVTGAKKENYLSDKEEEYKIYWRTRMENARDERNRPRDEFDGMGYLQAYDRDTKAGIAFIASGKNKGENEISTGTTRQALMALVARAISYNHETEFAPFGQNDELFTDLGKGLDIAVRHANYLDNDEDQAKERVNELLTHGDVVVYEDWVERWGYEKSHPKFDGKIKGVNWSKRRAKIFEGCERRTVQGRRFYFGDMYTTDDKKQPFEFEVNHITYADARAKYGEWERFKHVLPRSTETFEFDASAFGEDWRLEKGSEGTVEEVVAVDLPNNEMYVSLNGVPMLPMGFPSKWEHKRYPWIHQGAEPIRTGFVYHRSFVRTLLNMQDLENDLWRVLIMLAWQAAMPPMANNSGKVITRRALLGGEITNGVNPDKFKPLLQGSSLANTGFVENVLEKIRNNMTGRSVPEIKQGLGAASLNTATETMQVQKEAEIAISLNLAAVAGIQAKADKLRASNIMQFGFKKGYSASHEMPWKGGVARWVLEIVEKSELAGKTTAELSQLVKAKQDKMAKQEGRGVRIVQLQKNAAQFVDRLEARAVSKPKRSSGLDKIELQQMFQAASAVFGQRLNPEAFEGLFRSAYRIDGDMPLTIDIPVDAPGIAPQAKPAPAPVGAGLANDTTA